MKWKSKNKKKKDENSKLCKQCRIVYRELGDHQTKRWTCHPNTTYFSKISLFFIISIALIVIVIQHLMDVIANNKK